jgi:ERCC4-type nuclease
MLISKVVKKRHGKMKPEITIIQDTREQKPLKFSHQCIKEVVVKKLDEGDYGAETGDGLRLPLVFERKSINDLWGSLTQNYDRFREEIIRAREEGVELVVIVEGTLSRVMQGNSYSDRPASSLLAQIFYLRPRYGLETVFCTDPGEASLYIQNSFIALAKHIINIKTLREVKVE